MTGQKTSPLPPPPSPPRSAAEATRQALGRLGGIASCQALSEHLDGRSPRQIRDTLKRAGPAVRYLGAGYFALQHAPFEPVLAFAERWLAHPDRAGTANLDALVSAILAAYPRGDALAVRRWLQQEPGRLQREPAGDVIRLLHPRRMAPL